MSRVGRNVCNDWSVTSSDASSASMVGSSRPSQRSNISGTLSNLAPRTQVSSGGESSRRSSAGALSDEASLHSRGSTAATQISQESTRQDFSRHGVQAKERSDIASLPSRTLDRYPEHASTSSRVSVTPSEASHGAVVSRYAASNTAGLLPGVTGRWTSVSSNTQASTLRTSVADTELALAGYLLARAIDGRPVPSSEVSRLRTGNTSVNQTRQSLKHGRGNVDVDVRSTGNESRWRMKAARNFKDELDRRSGKSWEDYSTQVTYSAAAASVFGAGNCGEHASATSVYHSSRLQDQEQVHYVSSPSVRHAWAESRLPGVSISGESDRTVVMDAWASGPAVLATDARFARRRDGVRSVLQFNSETGRTARISTNDLILEARSMGTAELERRVQRTATPAARFAAFIDSVLPFGIGDWTEQPVLDNEFATRAYRTLIAPSNYEHMLGLASHIAGQLDVGESDRSAEARRIFEAARRLLSKR
jgi:hypothetical protein